MSFMPFLQGTTPSPASQLPQLLITVAAMIAIFYFFLIRPQKKKEQETKKMIDSLKKGDKVVTIGGVYGTVSSVKEATIVLKVDDNAKIEFSKNAISSLVTNETSAKSENASKASEKKAAAETNEADEKPARKTRASKKEDK